MMKVCVIALCLLLPMIMSTIIDKKMRLLQNQGATGSFTGNVGDASLNQNVTVPPGGLAQNQTFNTSGSDGNLSFNAASNGDENQFTSQGDIDTGNTQGTTRTSNTVGPG